jgi:hypothetical protein
MMFRNWIKTRVCIANPEAWVTDDHAEAVARMFYEYSTDSSQFPVLAERLVGREPLNPFLLSKAATLALRHGTDDAITRGLGWAAGAVALGDRSPYLYRTLAGLLQRRGLAALSAEVLQMGWKELERIAPSSEIDRLRVKYFLPFAGSPDEHNG